MLLLERLDWSVAKKKMVEAVRLCFEAAKTFSYGSTSGAGRNTTNQQLMINYWASLQGHKKEDNPRPQTMLGKCESKGRMLCLGKRNVITQEKFEVLYPKPLTR